MPANVEIKACVKNFEKLKKVAQSLSGCGGTLIVQEDTFFNVPNGRLKLRELQGRPAQLIHYDRPDQEGPKLSEFLFTEVSDPKQIKETLRRALGFKGVVKKHRLLYMVGQTRVHVDQVENLGNYMELEVQMQEGQTLEEGQAIAHDLMEKLGVSQDDLITGAYMDLILKKTEHINGTCS